AGGLARAAFSADEDQPQARIAEEARRLRLLHPFARRSCPEMASSCASSTFSRASNSRSLILPVSSSMYSSLNIELSRCFCPSSSSSVAAWILRATHNTPRNGASRMSSSISTLARTLLGAFLGVEVQLGEVVGRKRPALFER